MDTTSLIWKNITSVVIILEWIASYISFPTIKINPIKEACLLEFFSRISSIIEVSSRYIACLEKLTLNTEGSRNLFYENGPKNIPNHAATDSINNEVCYLMVVIVSLPSGMGLLRNVLVFRRGEQQFIWKENSEMRWVAEKSI